jgi:hypothetical protein
MATKKAYIGIREVYKPHWAEFLFWIILGLIPLYFVFLLWWQINGG